MEKTDLSDEERDNWILDSLVTYLSGPIWNTPILNFVEQKSVVFEGDVEHEDEYRLIHEEFRNLVDAMLGAYMDDLGLQPENLELALSQIQPSVRSAALQELLEPVQSAGDYGKFKDMMKIKNEELHKQALEMIRQNNKGLAGGDSDEHAEADEYLDEDIKEAIRLSLAEQEESRNATISEKRDVERALAISVAGLLAKNAEEEEESDPAINKEPIVEALEAKRTSPDPGEIERRRSLLKAQRDKILNRKRQERELQMEQTDRLAINAGLPSRPKSGLVARAALAGETTHNVDDKTLQYRRLLLQKIKEEVEGPPKV